MTDELQKHIQFLKDANVHHMEHTEHGLLSHLLGTRRLLQEWQARPALCDAALFHSVYGTERYIEAAFPYSMRAQVQARIGSEAEAVVWLFCVMRRQTLDVNISRGEPFVVHRLTEERVELSVAQFEDLVNLMFANELEPYPRMPETWRRECRAHLSRLRSAAMPGARKALDVTRPVWWRRWVSRWPADPLRPR